MPALTVEHAQMLVDACKTGRDRALIQLSLDSGLRANELANLNVGDVDTQQGTVLVRSGKGAKDRMVYIGNTTRRAINRYWIARRRPKGDAPLWLNEKTGKRLTRWGVRELCDRNPSRL
jgi:site-specific recombinase XerD